MVEAAAGVATCIACCIVCAALPALYVHLRTNVSFTYTQPNLLCTILVCCRPLNMLLCVVYVQGYAHLFNIPGAASPTTSSSSAAGVSGAGSAAARMSRLPGAFSDKFESHVMVPIDLWLQAHKEAQVRSVWAMPGVH